MSLYRNFICKNNEFHLDINVKIIFYVGINVLSAARHSYEEKDADE